MSLKFHFKLHFFISLRKLFILLCKGRPTYIIDFFHVGCSLLNFIHILQFTLHISILISICCKNFTLPTFSYKRHYTIFNTTAITSNIADIIPRKPISQYLKLHISKYTRPVLKVRSGFKLPPIGCTVRERACAG